LAAEQSSRFALLASQAYTDGSAPRGKPRNENMSIDIEYKKPNSALRPRTPRGNRLSEKQYLTREAASAKSALLASVAKLRSSAAQSLDVRRLARCYPLPTVAAAALAGFAAAAIAKRHRERAQGSEDRRPTNSQSEEEDASAGGNVDAVAEPPARSAIAALIITALLDVVKTAAQTFLLNALHPQPSDASPDEATDAEDSGVLNTSAGED
jgi:hypothetical protein